MSEHKLTLPATTTMRQLCLSVTPKKGGGHRYLKRGLSCRMVKPGIYRIHREDGGSSRCDVCLVEFMEPWKSQRVPGYVTFCRTHGLYTCMDQSDLCDLLLRKTTVPRWLAFVRVADPRHFEVVVLETLPQRRSRKTNKSAPASGAGFFVMHLSRAGG